MINISQHTHTHTNSHRRGIPQHTWNTYNQINGHGILKYYSGFRKLLSAKMCLIYSIYFTLLYCALSKMQYYAKPTVPMIRLRQLKGKQINI